MLFCLSAVMISGTSFQETPCFTNLLRKGQVVKQVLVAMHTIQAVSKTSSGPKESPVHLGLGVLRAAP